MISAQPRLSRVTSAIALSFAIAAVPAFAAGYLKLGDIKGESTAQGRGGQIEIESWSWGATQTSGTHVGGGGGGSGKVQMKGSKIGQNAPAKGKVETVWKVEEGEKAASGEKGGTEDINIGVGELQEGAAAREHDKRTTWVERSTPLPAPLPRGSVRVKTKMPWLACRVGARYPALELGDGTTDYRLTNAVVTGCPDASSSGGDRPMEEISFNYAKVEVRGWDPAKKEE